MTPAAAAQFGEVVLEAIPFGQYASLPSAQLKGKILISAANYFPQRDTELDMGDLAHTEFIARQLPGVRVVKAFNTIYYQHLGSMGNRNLPADERIAIYLAGDDTDAKAVVAKLIDDMGFTPVDTGSLADSRRQEPGTEIYNNPVTAREARVLLGV